MSARIAQLLFVILASTWASLPAASAQPPCVAEDEVATHGIRLGDSEAVVRKSLGKPIKASHGNAEDDGGLYPTRTLVYRSLTVGIGRNRTEWIQISAPGHAIVAGLRVGSPRDDLRSPGLIDNAELARGAAFGLRLCKADEHAITGLSIFLDAGVVTKAELYTYGP